MDRRKVKSKYGLHKSLHQTVSPSLSQLAAEEVELISSSASLAGTITRKRKNSQDSDNLKLSNDEQENATLGKSDKSFKRKCNDPINKVQGTRGNLKMTNIQSDSLLTKKGNIPSNDDDNDEQTYTSISMRKGLGKKKIGRKLKTSSVRSTVIEEKEDSSMELRKTPSTSSNITRIESSSGSDEDVFADNNESKRKNMDKTKTMNISRVVSQTRDNPFKLPTSVTNITENSKWKKLDLSEMPPKKLAEKNSVTSTALQKLINFLDAAGITLLLTDEPHVIRNCVTKTRETMEELLICGNYSVNEIVETWKAYMRDDSNLRKALNNLVDENEENNASDVSLLKMLLLVSPLQNSIINCIMDKITDVILTSPDEPIPWICLLIQQLRFLEQIYDADSLTAQIEQVLEAAPSWFRKELITIIPDIVTDSQHHVITEMLYKVIEKNDELISVGFNCISNLAIGKEYMEELRMDILPKLQHFTNINNVPAIVKFVLTDCGDLYTCKKVLSAICALDMEPYTKETEKDCYANQVSTLNVIRMNLFSSKIMGNAAEQVIKTVENEAKPFHIIILLLLCQKPSKCKQIESYLKQHIRRGIYRESLLNNLYNNYKEMMTNLQTVALNIASNLLKCEDRIHVDFAIEWFRLIFINQKDKIYKQKEIMETIVQLMGHDDHTVKNALAILTKMMHKKEELQYLRAHCQDLNILLEKVDDLGLEDIAVLCDLMHGLCINSQTANNELHDDLAILMRKQLFHASSHLKCKGVMNAVMAIKHLAVDEEQVPNAIDLFKKVITGVEHCPKAQALFYDQIGQVIAQTKNMHENFIKHITEYFQEKFVNTYCKDPSAYTGEYVPKFRQNYDEELNYVIELRDGMEGAIGPILFRVLRLCYQRLSADNNLEEINAVLGFAILAPENLDSPEPEILNFMINCVNWFREVIGGFVTQNDHRLRNQVIRRLDDLMTMQGELIMGLSMCDFKYQPPPCYFHYYPIPPFLKNEKKSVKKGKKGNVSKIANISEEEAWNTSSSICMKNPAYFRRLDTKIILLLDHKMEFKTSQASAGHISISQVLFIINELLTMFEYEVSESFMRDVIHLLPKIVKKLQAIVDDLREKGESNDKEAVKLLLRLLTNIFNWKEFQTAKYNFLLRDGLRTLACMMSKTNSALKSSLELVKESYKYFESLSDIATQISLAVALTNICQTLMKHSSRFKEQYQSTQADMVYGFLALHWEEDKSSVHTYRTAVATLLKLWLDNETNILNRISLILKDLPTEVTSLKSPQDNLEILPAINRNCFSLLMKKIFEGLIKGINISLNSAKRDPERIQLWNIVGENLKQIIAICVQMNTKANLLLFIRYVPQLLKIFLAKGIPVLEHNFKYQTSEVMCTLKLMQGATKHLHKICGSTLEKKDVALTKLIPAAKQVIEQLVFSVKGMMVLNNCTTAFWMGSLKNKNVEGEEILSQTSTEDFSSTNSADLPVEINEEESEMIGSDTDNDETSNGITDL